MLLLAESLKGQEDLEIKGRIDTIQTIELLCSCKIMNTLPSDNFNFSAISRNLIIKSVKTSLLSFLVFTATTSEFGWTLCSALFVSVRPRLKSTYHYLTNILDGDESEWYLSSHCLAWTIFFSIRNQCFINTWNSDVSIVLKICNSSFTYITNLKTNYPIELQIVARAIWMLVIIISRW